MAKYLNNRDLLSEINKSKTSFCYFIDDEYAMYDVIVNNLSEVDAELIEQVRLNKTLLINKELKNQEKKNSKKSIKEITVKDVEVSGLVFRVMTNEHVPLDLEKIKKSKNPEASFKTKTNFPPFKHYILDEYEDDFSFVAFKEVGRSHWKNGLANGQFCTTHGKISRNLALMFIKLVERYSQQSNWRGYSYIDEMQSQALLQLSQIGLQFDESKSSNPFAYYSETITNSFTRVLNAEKKCQHIRDELLIAHNSMPSFARQLQNEDELKRLSTRV